MESINPEMIKQIYPTEPDIDFSDNIRERLNARREQKYSFDKKAVEGDGVRIDIDSATEIPNGRIRIDYNGARFEGFFHKGTQKKIYITFNGARAQKHRRIPVPFFSRWSWYRYTDSFWLSLADPMYYDSDAIDLGWFFGTPEKNYREYAAHIVKRICDIYDIPYDEAVFYASSGGGTAAIHTAALFGSGTAIAVNAQFDFEIGSKWDKRHFEDLKEHLQIDIHKPDKFRRNDICGVIKSSPNVAFVIVVNVRSPRDTDNHLTYLVQQLGITPRYGLSRFDNIYLYLYDAKGKNPHAAFEDKNLFYAVNYLALLAKNRQDVEMFQPLYLLFGEFWHDKYETEPISDQNASPGVTLLDDNILSANGQPLPVMDYLQGIYIKAENDNYNCLALDLIKSVTHNIELRGTYSQTGANKYTVALIDFDNMTFVFNYTRNVGEPVKLSFMVGNTDHRLSLCVFAGKYGETAGHDLGIREIIMRWE